MPPSRRLQAWRQLRRPSGVATGRLRQSRCRADQPCRPCGKAPSMPPHASPHRRPYTPIEPLTMHAYLPYACIPPIRMHPTQQRSAATARPMHALLPLARPCPMCMHCSHVQVHAPCACIAPTCRSTPWQKAELHRLDSMVPSSRATLPFGTVRVRVRVRAAAFETVLLGYNNQSNLSAHIELTRVIQGTIDYDHVFTHADMIT